MLAAYAYMLMLCYRAHGQLAGWDANTARLHPKQQCLSDPTTLRLADIKTPTHNGLVYGISPLKSQFIADILIQNRGNEFCSLPTLAYWLDEHIRPLQTYHSHSCAQPRRPRSQCRVGCHYLEGSRGDTNDRSCSYRALCPCSDSGRQTSDAAPYPA